MFFLETKKGRVQDARQRVRADHGSGAVRGYRRPGHGRVLQVVEPRGADQVQTISSVFGFSMLVD